MYKHYLLAPGPTPVPEKARLAMAQSLVHHRGPEFREIFAEVGEHLRWLFQTEQTVLTLTASGTGAFEAAMVNFTAPGDEVLAIGGGKFGERWGEMAEALGRRAVQLDVEWGEAVEPGAVEKLLRAHPDCALVTLAASETSTGVIHPVEEIAARVSEHDALFAVDGITAVGVHDIPMDDWGIDILVAGSQKAFGLPPGLGFLAASEAAWERRRAQGVLAYYFDLARELDKQRQAQTAFTPAISQIVAAREVLRLMREESRGGIYERHRGLAAATRAGLRAIGLEIFASRPSNAVTAALAPGDLRAPDLVRVMRERYGVTIAGGQAHLKPRVFRVGHIGFFDRADVLMAISSLELSLGQLGHAFTAGAGVAAAQAAFASAEG